MTTARPDRGRHVVSGRPIAPPYPDGFAVADFGMGCYWGAEQRFWSLDGVWVTAAGYEGDDAADEVEVVRVVFDPAVVTYEQLLRVYWEGHDPTQVDRQGANIGRTYRSALFTFDEQQAAAARATRDAYARELRKAGFGPITTEVRPATTFRFAADHQQQYLARNPGATCSDSATGVACPTGLGVRA
jgi:peptide-methionine (S)-S-oxide reductase